MRSATAFASFILTLTVGLSLPADARNRGARNWAPPPLKDCTRLNGRYGYYGNPWCTPAEQLAWDRAEAKRITR
jgi:hypothetical protein